MSLSHKSVMDKLLSWWLVWGTWGLAHGITWMGILKVNRINHYFYEYKMVFHSGLKAKGFRIDRVWSLHVPRVQAWVFWLPPALWNINVTSAGGMSEWYVCVLWWPEDLSGVYFCHLTNDCWQTPASPLTLGRNNQLLIGNGWKLGCVGAARWLHVGQSGVI